MNIRNRDELMIAVVNRIPLATLPRIVDRVRAIWLQLKERQAEEPCGLNLEMAESGRPEVSRSPDALSLLREVGELLKHPEHVEAILPERIPPLLSLLAALQAALAARLMKVGLEPKPDRHAERDERLLTPDEAAEILKTSKRWLYRHASRLPFTRRLSRKNLRFAEGGLRRWMATRRPS